MSLCDTTEIIANRLGMLFWRTVSLEREICYCHLQELLSPKCLIFHQFLSPANTEKRKGEDRLIMWSTLQKGSWCSQATEEASADILQSGIKPQ